MKLVKVILSALIIAIPTYSLAAGGGQSESSGSLFNRNKAPTISGKAKPKIPYSLREMRTSIEEYEETYKILKAEEKRIKLEEYRKKLAIRKAIEDQAEKEKYKPKDANVFPDDIKRALQRFGVPERNIKIEDRDLHDVVIQLVCEEDGRALDLSRITFNKEDNMVSKEAFAETLNLNCK